MFDESGDGGGLEEEFDRDYCGECDEDLKIISTPRLRIMEAQVFDQKNGDEDEENSVLESIIVQNDEV